MPNPWVLIDSWTFSVNITERDFLNLGAYSELNALLRNITTANSGLLQAQVSINNGSSWLTASGDYKEVSGNDGSQANLAAASLHITAATTARGGHVWFPNWNMPTVPKVASRRNLNTTLGALLIPQANGLNALRINNSAGGNLTAGQIFVWGRL